MPNSAGPGAPAQQPSTYQIRIAGELDPRWTDWFDGLAVMPDGPDTVITGPVADQAALHGLLRRVRDLGLPLLSVTRVEPPARPGLPAQPPTPDQSK